MYSMHQEPATLSPTITASKPACLKSPACIDSEIVIARDGDRYRLLHGQLRLASRLGNGKEVCVDAKDEGVVKIIRARGRLLVESGNRLLPLHRNE